MARKYRPVLFLFRRSRKIIIRDGKNDELIARRTPVRLTIASELVRVSRPVNRLLRFADSFSPDDVSANGPVNGLLFLQESKDNAFVRWRIKVAS